MIQGLALHKLRENGLGLKRRVECPLLPLELLCSLEPLCSLETDWVLLSVLRWVHTYAGSPCPLCFCHRLFLTDFQIPPTATANRRHTQHVSTFYLPFHYFLTQIFKKLNLEPTFPMSLPFNIFCHTFPKCFSRWLLYKQYLVRFLSLFYSFISMEYGLWNSIISLLPIHKINCLSFR